MLIMKRKSYRFYALSVVFLATAIVFYQPEELSLAKFLIFFMSGVVAGVSLANGILAARQKQNK